MNAMAAMKQYQNVNTQAQVLDASPHRLIQMLMEGGLTRLAQAKGAMERNQVAVKGEFLSKAIAIIGGLQEALDVQQGGELAINLQRLYDYMVGRLLEANRANDPSIIDEVAGLLREVKSGWDGISNQI
ncbi:MAG: flagellar export chaperone FliS [Pseudomonadaceae bacterium]|uniref:flagellar export chaperone FliS n=1 Tax=Pseudomonas sp. Ga0074129 TaxID=1752219 RepID=UPI000ADAC025|nr:flagellar export chaperone FliS [Pseudomonas sp. Ga0074129]MBX9763432.1 flagellar export chaperone FliS [Pseudomonadaceae bacterium]